MDLRQEMVSTMQHTSLEKSQLFHEKANALKCSSVELLGFTNSYVNMLEDEFQAKVFYPLLLSLFHRCLISQCL
jgi:hypothetical protein